MLRLDSNTCCGCCGGDGDGGEEDVDEGGDGSLLGVST